MTEEFKIEYPINIKYDDPIDPSSFKSSFNPLILINTPNCKVTEKLETLLSDRYFYKLDTDKNIVKCSLLEWSSFCETKEKIVKQENVGKYWISTVFLGIDHNWPSQGAPLLFATMVFEKDDLDTDRYCTYEEALKGHEKMAERWKDKS